MGKRGGVKKNRKKVILEIHTANEKAPETVGGMQSVRVVGSQGTKNWAFSAAQLKGAVPP